MNTRPRARRPCHSDARLSSGPPGAAGDSESLPSPDSLRRVAAASRLLLAESAGGGLRDCVTRRTGILGPGPTVRYTEAPEASRLTVTASVPVTESGSARMGAWLSLGAVSLPGRSESLPA